MKAFRLSEHHWFEKFIRAYWILIRAKCVCGWESKACIRVNAASDKYYEHAMEKANE